MANRSHIYACDEVPGGKGFYARGLSEYGWDIPIVHKLMVATNPRIVRSAIWEHDIGILADRAGAFERTLAFVEKLGEGQLADRGEFDDELAQMKTFLAAAPESKYVLLEAGEILDLVGEDLGKLVADLHAELPELAAKAARAVAGQEDAWLDELRAEWGEKARPGYWSDILYYSFEPSKAATPANAATSKAATPSKAAKATKVAKPTKATKPAKANKKPSKKIAKKPTAKAAKKTTKKPAKKPAKRPTKKPAKKSAKKSR